MTPRSELLLQQICDSMFPIGAYSHSYGLETFIQLDIVHDAATTQKYVHDQIRYPLTYTELLGMRLAYGAAAERNLATIVDLENELEALKTPCEMRGASNKLATRFIRTILDLDELDTEDAELFACYGSADRDHAVNVAYGVFCALAGIDLDTLLQRWAYAQLSAMVVNCVKTVPLSQTAGQRIIAASFDAVLKACETAMTCDAEMLGLSCPGFDTRSIEHETLYSRLYMS